MKDPNPSGRQSVTVEIAGERHVIRSGAAPEYTQSVAAHVDETIRDLGIGSTLDPYRTAILAALTITDELFRTRMEMEVLRRMLASRATALAERLERATPPPEPPPGEPPSDRPGSAPPPGRQDPRDPRTA